MKIEDIETIFTWLSDGRWTPIDIAEFTGINPDIIDSICDLYTANVDLELYA